MTSLLQFSGIGKSFGRNRVLDGVSFDVRAGEVHVLAGENGAGKSTLIKILAGVHREFDGAVVLDGREVRFASPAEAGRHGVAVIHQELSLVDAMSVADNLFLGRETSRGGGWFLDRRAQVRRGLEICGELDLGFTEADLAKPVGGFSLSVKNRIEIAKALCFEARVFVLDEPTSALNRREVDRLFEIVARLRQRGCGIIYITHKMEEIYRLADRITVLRDGKWVGTATAAECPRDRLVQWMIGRELAEQIPARATPLPQPPVARLEIEGLVVPDPDPARPPAIRGFSLTLHAGEIVGVAGLQGSGNGELFRALFGAYGDVCGGGVRLDGQPFRPVDPARSILSGVCYLAADRKACGIVPTASVAHNITLASLRRFSTAGVLNARRERERARLHVDALRVKLASLDQPVVTLSGGNQQKVLLAKWLETEPRVLLLEEPTRGVDVGAKHEIYELMRRCADEGMAILLISTELPELLGLSDRIVVLHRGEVSAVLTHDEATPANVLSAAMGVAA